MEGSQSFILVRKQRRVEQELREWKIYIYIYISAKLELREWGKKCYAHNIFTTLSQQILCVMFLFGKHFVRASILGK